MDQLIGVIENKITRENFLQFKGEDLNSFCRDSLIFLCGKFEIPFSPNNVLGSIMTWIENQIEKSFSLEKIFVYADEDFDDSENQGGTVNFYRGQVMIRMKEREYTDEEVEIFMEQIEVLLQGKYGRSKNMFSIEQSDSGAQGWKYMTFSLEGDEFIKHLLTLCGLDMLVTDDNDAFWKPIWEERFETGHLAHILTEAVEKGSINEGQVIESISRGASINTFNKDGDTVLHLPAKLGNIRFAKTLLQMGADPSRKNRAEKTYFDFLRRDVPDDTERIFKRMKVG